MKEMDALRRLVDELSYRLPTPDGFDSDDRKDMQAEIMKFAKAIVKQERERCANIADEKTRYSPYTPGDKDTGWKMAAHTIRDLIK